MKNTFAVTMTLLLALALGGSYAGYRIATTPHEAGSAAEGTQTAGETPAAGATSPQTATNEQHSPASPTVQGSQGTELGQTGATNTEKATAGNPAVSDSTAAAVASATAGDTAQGLKLFTANCAGCHGAQAQGGVGPALNTATGPGSWMIAQFQAAVREGHAPDRELGPAMPRFTTAQISDEDLTDIYAYLKSLVK